MKNKLLILSVFVLLAIAAMAQKGHELVIGAGGSFSSVWIMNQNFYGEPELNYAPKAGYSGSFHLGYNLTENFSIMTELQYSIQGQKYEDKQVMEGVKYEALRDITLTYLHIPLFFKYAFGTSSTKFRFMFGPQFGKLLDATQTYTRDGKTLGTEAVNLDGETFKTDAKNIKDRFVDNDISLALDVGADIHLSDKFFISPGFRANYGFKDINAEAYRIKDLDGEYAPSHNVWAGLFISIHYKIDVEGYNQRSF